ncbi:hypothetical protein P8452_65695 [Trifolium repens]|nr:hypothetical protein P8452_65695 [Trifolium repens]
MKRRNTESALTKSKPFAPNFLSFEQICLYSEAQKCRSNGEVCVVAKVVDEFDSAKGCDEDHDYQPPCPNNIVDASKAVWEALGAPESQWGGLDITSSDT